MPDLDPARAFSPEFIELRAVDPRREGPTPDSRPEDQLRRYLTAIDVGSLAVFGFAGNAAPPDRPLRLAGLDDWELAVWIAEGLLRHGLGDRGDVRG